MKSVTTSAIQLLLTGLMTAAVWLPGLWQAGHQAYALEKYGRPLPEMEKTKGAEEGTQANQHEDESLIGGYLLAGAFISNPSFAARPDNTGRVGMRYMLHAETDLYKKYLTFYSDQNFFSDRDNGWIELSEWDQTYGITGAVDHWFWRMQYERDAPLDKSGLKQIYADGMVNYRIRSQEDWAWWRKMFPKNGLTAYAGLGWLFHNQQYFARPITPAGRCSAMSRISIWISTSRSSCCSATSTCSPIARHRILSTHPSWTGSSASPCAGATSS